MDLKTKELYNLLEFYESNLCNRIFRYQLNNKIDIDIRFYKENFCHLLGIQHVFQKDKKYLGVSGYQKIKEKRLTINHLKKHNKLEYNKLELKLRCFEDIYSMLKSGAFIKFYQFRAKPSTTIVADFIIYQDRKEYMLHLFLRRENNTTNQYSPISFVVKSVNDRNYKQYIEGQEYKKITYFEIVEV